MIGDRLGLAMRRLVGPKAGLAASLALLAFALTSPQALAATGAAPGASAALDGIVHLSATIPNAARTAGTLGTAREGTGVVIDDGGLVVTIGYLILEATEVTVSGPGSEPIDATIVAYDHESGLGLVRARRPLNVAPLPLGDASKLRPLQPLLVASRTDALDAAGVYLVDRREFAGSWEYLLEDAIFTSPPHAEFGGAGLIDEGGRLVGIGSLFVNDATFHEGNPIPGNMFVPIDLLKPIMADLLARGRRAEPPRPWLGVSLEEHRGRLFVTRVSPDGPAAAGGI
ncbi:MAG: S1C family serine protease, partial [Geminicoccaceae bacterium]